MIQPPLFILEQNNELYIYRSEEDLAIDLEPVDVRNGEYEAFDSKATVLRLGTRKYLVQKLPWFLGGDLWRETVSVEETDAKIEIERLVSILNAALDLLPHPPEKRPPEAAELIELTVAAIGYSP